MKEFLVVLRGDHHRWDGMSPADRQGWMEQYNAWVRSLKERNLFVGGAPLTAKGKLLRPEAGGRVGMTDSPFAETKEAMTGYFRIRAEDLDHAAKVARDCPALRHEDSVEVLEESGSS